MVIGELLGRVHYLLLFALASGGLVLALGASNLIRRIAGLALAFMALILFFAAAGVLPGANAPIVDPRSALPATIYSNPLPQALMLGFVVVAGAVLLLATAIAIRIRESYGGVEAAEIAAADETEDAAERAP